MASRPALARRPRPSDRSGHHTRDPSSSTGFGLELIEDTAQPKPRERAGAQLDVSIEKCPQAGPEWRYELYDSLGLRQDSLFELVDAALTAPHRSTLVRLSLTVGFRRLWSSTCDALADGSIEVTALRDLFAKTLVDSALVDGRPPWEIDGTNWSRPAARASAARTWEYRPLPGWPQNGVVPARSYRWLVATPDVAGSWVLPLDVHAADQRRSRRRKWRSGRSPRSPSTQNASAPRPVVTLDSGYDLETLARATVDADLLVRLAKKRVVYRAPEQHAGRGRPRLNREPFRLADEYSYGQPQRSSQLDHPAYGAVTIDVWTDPPRGWRPERSVQCGARSGRAPAQQEAATTGLMAGLDRRSATRGPERVWRWYLRRFTVEHAFRFFEQTLGWTTVRPRHADAADRWSWLIAGACWQLWLARPLVNDVRMPWEHPRPDGLVTPGQVRRHFTGILVRVATPARVPRKRGKSPGRQPGQRPRPPLHYEVARCPPRRAA